MYTEQSLVSELVEEECRVLSEKALASGEQGYDPKESCSGIRWLFGLVELDPNITLEKMLGYWEDACDKDPKCRAWGCGLLSNQGHRLYPDFRERAFRRLSPSQCILIMERGLAFTEREKKIANSACADLVSLSTGYRSIVAKHIGGA
jgi:hypothetical protein